MIKLLADNYSLPSSILVDTNVLLWVFYGKYGFKIDKYKASYSKFLSKSLQNKVSVYTTSLNVSEVFHLIEYAEFKFYCEKNNIKITSTNRTAELKKYRSDSNEQNNLKKEFFNVYNQITKQMHILSSNVSHKDVVEYINQAPNCPDFFDLAFIKICNDNLIKSILTDDSDFKNLSKNFDIYTNNVKMKSI